MERRAARPLLASLCTVQFSKEKQKVTLLLSISFREPNGERTIFVQA